MFEENGISINPPSFNSSEIDFLQCIRNDPLMAHMLVNRACQSSTKAISEWLQAKTRNPLSESLFIIKSFESDSKEFVPAGYISYIIDDDISKNASIGICLAKQYQGKGLGYTSIKLTIHYLRTVLNVRKFTYKALESNMQCRKLFAKLGFSEVGTYKNHFWSLGSYHNIVAGELLDLSKP